MEAASVYQEIREPDRVRYRGWYGDTELVSLLAPPRDAQKAVSREEGREILDHAADAAHRWGRGVFHTTLLDPEEAKCRWCAYGRVCRVDAARNAAVAEGDSDVQRPREIVKVEP